jgi:hypothetical protein
MSTPRRDFLGWIGATAIAGSAPAMLVGAPMRSTHSPFTGSSPVAPANGWDMSWVSRIRGRYRAVFDAPQLSEGDPILRAVVWGKQYQEVFGTELRNTSRVLVLRHHGIEFAMNDSYWARFPVAKENGFTDAAGQPLKVNPVRAPRAEVPEPFRSMTLEAFQESGGIVLGCQLALHHYVVARYVGAGLSQEAARTEATRNLLPGVIMQPSGIFAVSVAQEADCVYVPVS